MLKAMNLVTRRDAGDEALGGRSAVRPQSLPRAVARARAVRDVGIGPRLPTPTIPAIDERDVVAFIARAESGVSRARSDDRDVTLVHRGVVPAVRSTAAASRSKDTSRSAITRATGIEGLLSVAGTKYTTARAVAERVTDTLAGEAAAPAVPCRTAAAPLPGGSVRDVGLAIAEPGASSTRACRRDTIPHLIAAYGSRYRDVMDLAANRPDWRTRIARDSPVIGAELILAARKEMALTLADVVIRRTPLGALGYPGDDALARAAAIVGAELGWTEERRREEIAAVQRFYRTVSVARSRSGERRHASGLEAVRATRSTAP